MSNPALLNEAALWYKDINTACPQSPLVILMIGIKFIPAQIIWIEKEITIIFLTNVITPLVLDWLSASLSINELPTPILAPNIVKKNIAIVINDKPPISINTIIVICPKTV